jgi:hypothetical protein
MPLLSEVAVALTDRWDNGAGEPAARCHRRHRLWARRDLAADHKRRDAMAWPRRLLAPEKLSAIEAILTRQPLNRRQRKLKSYL